MSAKRTNRNALVAALYSSGGYTYRELGDHYGISRERVRQIIERDGGGREGHCSQTLGADPIGLLRIIRSPDCVSMGNLKAAAGYSRNGGERRLNETLGELGLLDAVLRLFRLRRRRDLRARIIEQIRDLYAQTGRTSASDARPFAGTAQYAFGSWLAAVDAAGVPRSPRGYAAHRRTA